MHPSLAILGGPRTFDEPRHVGAPNLPDRARLLELINDLLDRRQLANHGPLALEFEARIAERCGFRHAIATCNATVGLEIATRALGFTAEAIVPSWTFVATAHALRWQEVRPLFADVDARTHLLDPDSVRRLITPHTSGIVGVHLWGNRCDVGALRTIAEEHDLRLVMDAAHAFGTKGATAGSRAHADAEVLSFHATKFLNTFEGGAILTDDDDLAERVRLMTNFGFTGRDQVGHIGINGKMSEASAAMGLASLESVDTFIAHNRANYDVYRDEFTELDGLELVEPWSVDHNFQYVVVDVDETRSGLTRDELVRVLEAENINARRYFHPGAHRMEPYRSEQPNAGILLPVTERLAERTLTLPTGTSVSTSDVLRITSVLQHALDMAPLVRRTIRAADARLTIDLPAGS